MLVVIQPSADVDLSAIFDWIAAHDPIAAERHVRRLVDAAARLATFPERGAARPDLGDGARSIVVGQYLILYRTMGDRVEIVRFAHGSRRLGALFDVEA